MPALEILRDLFFVERGYLSANHFVLRSEAPVLIDTAYVSAFGETQARLSELGVRIGDVRRIVSTHSHCDHVGGNRRIQDASGCEVAMHPAGRHFADRRDDWSTWWRYYDQEAEFFRCTESLADGEILPVGPHEFRVLHTPGHSSDGIVLYHPKEKILLSSDTLWERDIAVMTVRVEGSRAMFAHLESLEKLEALDVRMVFPGHGRPFSDMKAAIDRSRSRIRGFLECPESAGMDLLKKIIVYTLLMRGAVQEEGFLDSLRATHWFPETVDLYFAGRYERTYREVMAALAARGVVVSANGRLSTTVRP